MKAYMGLLFILTLAVGVSEVASVFGIEIPYIPSDIAGGLVMIVISAIFLRGLLSREAEAYYYVGSVILAVFGVLYILVILAEIASGILAGEKMALNFRPEPIILPFAIPGIMRFIERGKEAKI